MVMSQNLPYGTKTLYTKFELDLWGVRIRAKSLNFWKFYRGPKLIFSIFFNFVVRKMRQDERIPNLVSKLKSDNI